MNIEVEFTGLTMAAGVVGGYGAGILDWHLFAGAVLVILLDVRLTITPSDKQPSERDQ